jgi:ADP-ribose pyrophosphatase YjhB (NUDIX family)
MMSFNKSYSKKKDFKKYCANCNSNGHEYQECKEPATSWGVILVKLNGLKLKEKEEKINIKDLDVSIDTSSSDSPEDLSYRMTAPQFLMVQRKFSLGYVEFIKGDYEPSNIDGVYFIFAQMLSNEIDAIKNKTFDQLWFDFWDYTNMPPKKKERISKMYNKSKNNYEKLLKGTKEGFTLETILNEVNLMFDEQEWGFPKGRRNARENHRDCAVREFHEETGIPRDKIQIVEQIEPIIENLTGTDGKKYKHIYYVAILLDDVIKPSVNTDGKYSYEVGSAQFKTRFDCCQSIRNYHREKKEIVFKLYRYIVENSYLENDNDNKGKIDKKSNEDDIDLNE